MRLRYECMRLRLCAACLRCGLRKNVYFLRAAEEGIQYASEKGAILVRGGRGDTTSRTGSLRTMPAKWGYLPLASLR